MMQTLAASGVGGGEGVDLDLTPDVLIADGDVYRQDRLVIARGSHAGHFGNHLCFL
jgi:hypothetical protein